MTLKFFVLCERYFHVNGEPADWDLCYAATPADREAHLTSFERPPEGTELPERRAFQAMVEVPRRSK